MMTNSTEKNLNDVQEFIKQLQASSKKQHAGGHLGQQEVAIPKLEQLSKVIDAVNEQLQEKVLEVEQEHNINTKQRISLIGEMKQTMAKGDQPSHQQKPGKGQDQSMDYEQSDEVSAAKHLRR